jgi:hypothetical protein
MAWPATCPFGKSRLDRRGAILEVAARRKIVNHVSDDEHIERTHNIPRFFVEHHAIAWLLMVLVIAWGVFAYSVMPKLKDPKTSAREALVIVQWPVDGGAMLSGESP